jgi:predicted Zn-dependent protease
LLLVGLIAIGCAKTPYQQRKDAQARQVAELRPAELEHDASSWRALRSLRLRLYASGDLARQRVAFEERLTRANQVLESALRLRVVLEEVRALPANQQAAQGLRGQDMDAAMRALDQLDPAQDVDFVVAIVAASPIVTLSFHELGRAVVLGKHIVVRTMDDVAELQALEGFDTLEREERSQLYQQRKRHKETAVLLHELGHALGAVHTRDPLELMHPAYDNATRGFAPANVELMSMVVQARLADPNGEHDQRELYRQLSAHLRAPEGRGWVEEDRTKVLAMVEAGLTSGAEPPKTTAATTAAEPPAKPAPDLSALSEPDRARFAALDQQTQQEQWQEAFAAVSELAKSYPDSLPVQQKACEIGMTLGVSRKTFKPFCDRMLVLSTRPQ